MRFGVNVRSHDQDAHMSSFAIGGLQLEAQGANNVDQMIREIDEVMQRFPWLNMVLCPELAASTDKAAAEAMPGRDGARAPEDHGDVVPVGEAAADMCRAGRIASGTH